MKKRPLTMLQQGTSSEVIEKLRQRENFTERNKTDTKDQESE